MRNVTCTIHAQVHCWQGSRWNEQSPQIKSSLGISGIRLNDALQGNNKYLSPSALQPISSRLCQSIDIQLWVSGNTMSPPPQPLCQVHCEGRAHANCQGGSPPFVECKTSTSSISFMETLWPTTTREWVAATWSHGAQHTADRQRGDGQTLVASRW